MKVAMITSQILLVIPFLFLINVHGGAPPRASIVPPSGSTFLTSISSISRHARVALAGGIAGAVGTAVLYPVDTAKTLRQANPTRYQSVRHALMDLIFPTISSAVSNPQTTTNVEHTLPKLRRILRVQKAYRGVIPATLGAIPSSALYFGAYETSKTILSNLVRSKKNYTNTFQSRLCIHALAAASGNAISSLVFVPKEFIKQQLQYSDTKTVWSIVTSTLKQRGILGLYCGYQATLVRNIPSAMIRFVLYEEFKERYADHCWPAGLFVAGAVAGAVASGCMTPIDVIKTRLATKTIPMTGLLPSLRHVYQTEGLSALYAGAPSRMIWSGAFSAIGFGTFELAKEMLGAGVVKTTGTVTSKSR